MPFDGLDERGFLAADVRAAAGLDLYVKGEIGAENLVPEKALGPGLVDGVLEAQHGQVVFTPAVDVAYARAHCEAGDGHAFHQPVGVAFHDVAVLDGAGLAFVGVAHQVLGRRGQRPGEGPLEPGGKAGAPSAPKPRSLHHLHHLLPAHGESLFEALVTAPGDIVVHAHGVDLVDVPEERQVIGAGRVVA